MKIEAGKYYKTRAGDKAYIYETSLPGLGYSIHGRVESEAFGISLRGWYSDGSLYGDHKHADDLIIECKEESKMLAYCSASGQLYMFPEGSEPDMVIFTRMPHLDEPKEIK